MRHHGQSWSRQQVRISGEADWVDKNY